MNLNRSDFEEFIEKLSRASLDEIIEAVASDADLRGYLAATAGNLRNQADVDRWNADPSNWVKGEDHDFYHFWESTQYLKDWSWKDAEKFDTLCDRKAIAYWAPILLKALVQRMKSVHSQSVQRELDGYAKELEKRKKAERLAEFIRRIPPKYRSASIHDFTREGWKHVIEDIRNGGSYLIFGGNGIGKTHLAYALAMSFLENGKNCEMRRLFPLLQAVSAFVQISKMSPADVIDHGLVKTVPSLIIDECDKVSQQDTAFRNFSYLIDRRYEEQLQTILFCNARSRDELEAKLGSSLCDRFQDRGWNANIADFTAAQSRRGAS